jgi:hypothetical protein
MKAICLHQPYASAIAACIKTVETRDYRTSHRGRIAICSTRRDYPSGREKFAVLQGIAAKYFPHQAAMFASWDALPFGHVVCLATIADVRPADGFTPGIVDAELGDFSPWRFVWILKEVRPLLSPIPVRGRQGLFNIPDL